jgi:hypothetical protein
MTDTTCDINRIDADETRKKAPWSEKFPLIIDGSHTVPVNAEPEPEARGLKAAARIALQLGGED